MKRLRLPLIAVTIILFAASSSHAQFSFRRTVGDASFNSFTPGVTEANRFRNGVISSPSQENLTAGSGNYTRHTNQGSYTGIGGSTLQTTSVTAESRPAMVRPTSLSAGTPLISRPPMNLHEDFSFSSPALRSYAVQGPLFDREPLFGRNAETFTEQPSLRSKYGVGNFTFDF